MMSRKAKKSKTTSSSNFESVLMNEWTVSDVCSWLESLSLGEYTDSFTENEVSGEELVALTKDELKELGVKKIGHKKKLWALIHPGEDSSTSGVGSGASRSTSRMLTTSSSESSLMIIKVSYGDVMRRLKLPLGCRLTEVKAEISSRLKIGSSFTLRYRDDDGDKVSISREDDWQECLDQSGAKNVRLYVSRRSSSRRGKSTKSSRSREVADTSISSSFVMYDALLSAMIVINPTGIIQYLNPAAKKLSGYNNLIGRNVKMLMPPEHATRHDGYLSAYMRTGEAKVIGSGRNVAMLTKDGTFVPIHLSVTETEVSGKKFFVGTLATAKEEAQKVSLISMVRDVLNSLSNPSVAITENGTIQVFNEAAQKIFGYDLVDVVGKNVKMLMPPQQAEKHDGYLANYLSTGEAKIIGSGRDIVIKTKSGELKKKFLTVTERDDGRSHIFTGVFSSGQ